MKSIIFLDKFSENSSMIGRMADESTVELPQKSKHSIFDVARYILETIGGEVSTVKLQKLCYYAQAWHLARYGTELFPEEFEKWDNGPVCRELYAVRKGKFSINKHQIPPELCTNAEFIDQEHGTLGYVLDRYGPIDGNELSLMTHGEDPWKNTQRNAIIGKVEMEKYYFDRWEDDGSDVDDDGSVLTAEDIQRALDAPRGPIYNNVTEMFRAILG
jgi:uncharacterized phage-associated protein